MIFRIIKRCITLGKINGIEDRIVVFYAAGKLTDEEYAQLLELLDEVKAKAEAASSEATMETN